MSVSVEVLDPIALRPVFRVDGLATVKHLNVRKEGPPDLFGDKATADVEQEAA